MENIIKIRYDKEINQHLDVLAKHFIANNAGLEEKEMFEEVNGFEGMNNYFCFVYDEEVGGEIIMHFTEDKDSSFIEISSDYVYDVITMHEIIEPLINRVEV